MTAIHDLGFIAVTKEVGGETVRGFKMVVGGGTSIMARIAPTLYEFVPLNEYLRVSEAVFRVFDAADELRKNRMKARIKFLVDRIGIDEFRKLVDAELAKPWAKGEIDPEPWIFEDDELADAPPSSRESRFMNGDASTEFTMWASTNVRPQAQEGYVVVEVTVPQGDLTGDQFRGLAEISRRYAGGRARLTQEQNLVLRWVSQELTADVWNDLKALDLVEGGADKITDVVTCPGTDSCKLGITSSMGLGRALREKIASLEIDDSETQKMHVKASGCPNGCGQHHIASIGFHGAAIKGASGQQVPAYEVFVGGNATGTEGPIRIGQRVKGRVPAKLAPEFVERALNLYRSERESEDERFLDFVDRVGPDAFSPLLADLQQVGPLGKETIHVYMDWSKTIPFKVERGEGECAV
jgi:sulfite reductase beta subunit-like hemoprotein